MRGSTHGLTDEKVPDGRFVAGGDGSESVGPDPPGGCGVSGTGTGVGVGQAEPGPPGNATPAPPAPVGRRPVCVEPETATAEPFTHVDRL
jgi:hypothetical protein